MKPAWKSFIALFMVTFALITFFLTTLAAGNLPGHVPAQVAVTGTDLAIEDMTLSPPNPHTTQPATITVRARNVGSTSVIGRRIYLYIDPAERPPISTTQATKEFVVGVEWPPGDEMMVEYAEFTFSNPGCGHVVYAWVDPLGLIAETDEGNNLKKVDVCVEPEVGGSGPDSYEDDDVCTAAGTVPTDGTPQTRNFSPQGDVDWAKIQVTKGMTYTVGAAGIGAESWPTLELWSSCGTPPGGSFGTTSRIQFTAPDTGWYHLKIENEQTGYDPFESSYRLTVRAEGAAGGLLPVVTEVNPILGYNDRNTNVVITGTNFVFPIMAELCPYQAGSSASDACTQLLDSSWITAQRLFAIVQANIAPGNYSLAVTNNGGRRGTLPNAFTVLSGPPDLREVRPARAYSDVPTDLNVYGFNFAPGISVTLGSTVLENIIVVNRTHLRATVPAGLSPGTYTMTASIGSGAQDALPHAYTVLVPQEDLFGQAQELWVDPVAPRAGSPAKVGMVVHRRGGTTPLNNILVRFSVNGTIIGDAAVPLLSPDSDSSTERLDWTPAQEGDYQMVALIDPNNQLTEASEANNIITRTVTVLPPAADTQAPHVDSLAIAGGQTAVTSTLVHLDTTATDFPQPGGVGVSDLRYIEFEYNEGAQLWIPVQDSDWISYTLNNTSYPWVLTPVGGSHFVQSWARDAAGNVSVYPYQSAVNYLPTTEFVARNQTRVYRQSLAQGDSLQATVRPLSGDADLYIWPPDWQDGRPPWVSNLSGTSVDALTIASAPVSGTYQIEVYGYTNAQYEITIQTGTSLAGIAGIASVGGTDPDKTKPTTPAVPLDSEPPRNVPAASTPTPHYNIYLPLIRR